MTSLTALAHSTAPAAPVLSSTFYATAATVIPVLFIAISLQGQFQQDLLSGIASAVRWLLRWMGKQPRDSIGVSIQAFVGFGAMLAIGTAFWVTGILILCILLFGAFGEIAAILALVGPAFGKPFETQETSAGIPLIVLLSLVLLTAVAAAAAALALGKHAVSLWRGPAATRRLRREAWRADPTDDGGFG
jgi:hypothetical protein